jgi:hypothetical protein
MSDEYEVHGQHDHAVEHAAFADSLGRTVAMFTAVLATIGALGGIAFWIAAWL